MKNLFKSLAEFQQEVKVIHKATQGYGYSYTDLPKIFSEINPLMKKHGEYIKPLLQKHGLAYYQVMTSNNTLVTALFHVETTEKLESIINMPLDVELKGMNKYQVMGSAISYIRKYQLCAILGIVSDEKSIDSLEKHEPKKPAIDNKRFLEALKSIQQGEFTVEKLKAKFELTEEQTNVINEL